MFRPGGLFDTLSDTVESLVSDLQNRLTARSNRQDIYRACDKLEPEIEYDEITREIKKVTFEKK